jgi:hypothetical protein
MTRETDLASRGVMHAVSASHLHLRAFLRIGMCMSIVAPLFAGCVIGGGPDRPIAIEQDLVMLEPLTGPDLQRFFSSAPRQQASDRNQIITARMYVIDMEYSKYEANLTREIQTEGLAATLVSMGLTTTASLIAVESTSHILSGAATVVTGSDKAFNEKLLLSNTIQALQTQMRADRKEMAAEIWAKILRGRVPTSIDEYPLAMALSDVEHYRQVGTIASALIGLSKTVAIAEQRADRAKAEAGPAPDQVAMVKDIARPPVTPPVEMMRPPIITNPTVPIQPVKPAPVVDETGLTDFEQRSLFPTDIRRLQAALCLKPDGDQVVDGKLGPAGSATRKAIGTFLTSIKQPPSEKIDKRVWTLLNSKLIRTNPVCSKQG